MTLSQLSISMSVLVLAFVHFLAIPNWPRAPLSQRCSQICMSLNSGRRIESRPAKVGGKLRRTKFPWGRWPNSVRMGAWCAKHRHVRPALRGQGFPPLLRSTASGSSSGVLRCYAMVMGRSWTRSSSRSWTRGSQSHFLWKALCCRCRCCMGSKPSCWRTAWQAGPAP